MYIAADSGLSIWETRIVDGHPAIVYYSPSGNLIRPTYAFLYDRSRGIEYRVIGVSPRIGGSADAVVRIVRSLLPPADTQ